MKEEILEILERDMVKLRQEIDLYEDSKKLWITAGEIKNPAGNLALHITGNVKHYIGAVLGETGYIRDRDAEFSMTNMHKEVLMNGIDEALEVLQLVLGRITEEDLHKDYPAHISDKKMNIGYLLMHIAAHLNYHLGQINYHRRLVN